MVDNVAMVTMLLGARDATGCHDTREELSSVQICS